MTGSRSAGGDEQDPGKRLEHLRRAAEEASDPNRLLPGEPAESELADDARLWVEVYSELLDYKRRLVAVTREKLAELRDEAARREVLETDAVVIEAELVRFERRLAYWHSRLQAGH